MNCQGIFGECTTKVNLGCTCYPIYAIPEGHPWDIGIEDMTQAAFAAIGPDSDLNKELQCAAGLGKRDEISAKDKFVNWTSLKSAMADFCNDAGRRSVSGVSKEDLSKGKVINAHYNKGVYDEMDLRITWFQNDQPLTMDFCIELFKKIFDSCDKDEVNKHGGANTYMKPGNVDKIAVVEIIPTGSLQKGETQCRGKDPSKDHYTAPRHEAGVAGGPSVDAAIDQWCSDNDGKTVDWRSGTDNVFWRFPIDNLGKPQFLRVKFPIQNVLWGHDIIILLKHILLIVSRYSVFLLEQFD